MLKRHELYRNFSVVLLLFFLSSTLYFISVPESDNDLLGHLLFGKIIATQGIPKTDSLSYTAYGLPWINHEWFLEFMWWKAYLIGEFSALFIYKLLFCTLTVATLFFCSRTVGVSLGVASIIGVISVSAMARGLSIRPQLFSYFILAFEMSVLRKWQKQSLETPWILILLFLLWANCHGAFILGLLVLGIFSLFEMYSGTERCQRAWSLFFLCTIATLINPYGMHLYEYIFDEIFRSHPITEWAPVSFHDLSHLPFFVIAFIWLLGLRSLLRDQTMRWNVIIGFLLMFLAVRHQRHVPTLVIVTWIANAEVLEGAWQSKKKFLLENISNGSVWLLMTSISALIVFQGASAIKNYFGEPHIRHSKEEYPVGVVSFLEDRKCSSHIAVPLEWGSYVLWHLSDFSKVSLDGRFATVYPEKIVEMNFDFFEGIPRGEDLLSSYATDMVILPKGLSSKVREIDQWRAVMSDDASELFVKRGSPCEKRQFWVKRD